uniref:Secreted protein n=1 Tax=Cucumis melo TaxID=3656 RepID=A0A9I9EIR1_CUCME
MKLCVRPLLHRLLRVLTCTPLILSRAPSHPSSPSLRMLIKDIRQKRRNGKIVYTNNQSHNTGILYNETVDQFQGIGSKRSSFGNSTRMSRPRKKLEKGRGTLSAE